METPIEEPKVNTAVPKDASLAAKLWGIRGKLEQVRESDSDSLVWLGDLANALEAADVDSIIRLQVRLDLLTPYQIVQKCLAKVQGAVAAGDAGPTGSEVTDAILAINSLVPVTALDLEPVFAVEVDGDTELPADPEGAAAFIESVEGDPPRNVGIVDTDSE